MFLPSLFTWPAVASLLDPDYVGATSLFLPLVYTSKRLPSTITSNQLLATMDAAEALVNRGPRALEFLEEVLALQEEEAAEAMTTPLVPLPQCPFLPLVLTLPIVLCPQCPFLLLLVPLPLISLLLHP